jgi:glycosyltransferase involved in cell wall biosynthesis
LKKVSLVIPCLDEGDAIVPMFHALDTFISRAPAYQFELVFVNDGSSDDTLQRLLAAQESRDDVVVVDLSRNFGKEAALSAGLAVATGDAVVPLDADLQDPPEVILSMLELWEQGNEVVVAQRSDRSVDSMLKRTSARLFYRVHNAMSDVAIPHDVGDFRLMDRVVVDAVKLLPENRRFMKGLFAWIGFRTATVPYTRQRRNTGQSRFNGWRLWNLAIEGITSFSLLPLRIWTYVGVLVATGSLAWAFFILFRTIVLGRDVPGYASLIVAVLFLGGLQLIGIGIIGEYLGRTYMESKRRPAYVVRRVFHGRGKD